MLFIEGKLECESWLYKRPLRIDGPVCSPWMVSTLNLVAKGDMNACFEIATTTFKLKVFNGAWGVRRATVAECRFSTIGSNAWPNSPEATSKWLLDDSEFISIAKAAFLVDSQSLAHFQSQFATFEPQANCFNWKRE